MKSYLIEKLKVYHIPQF
ncbi:hypothetical protein F383_33427 [Gossypium arboreum]|uniref:Uncharacterized protein n=1 Tax=Gossypium arboreum TaxID=29729 RepID=A0A0B0N159_GOSAR|nr:hypothetical protein F383_33427 [Gossypium arboreum]